MRDEFAPKWRGKEITLTLSAYRELEKYRMDTTDLIMVLEDGFDCPRSKRKEGVLEKCIIKGKKVRKVVVVDQSDYWLIIHVGEFTASKKSLRRFKF